MNPVPADLALHSILLYPVFLRHKHMQVEEHYTAGASALTSRFAPAVGFQWSRDEEILSLVNDGKLCPN